MANSAATFNYESKNFSHTWPLGTEIKNLSSFASNDESILLRTGRIILNAQPENVDQAPSNMEFFLELTGNTQQGYLIIARIQMEKPKLHDLFTNSFIKVTDVMLSGSEQVWERGYHRRSFPIARNAADTSEDAVNLERNFTMEEINAPNVNWFVWRQQDTSTTSGEGSTVQRRWDNVDHLTFEVTVKSLLWSKFISELSSTTPKGDCKGFLHTSPLFLSEKQSDLVVVCGNREFYAHKLILGSKSSVFLTMFENPMKESLGGRVEIEDFEEDIVEDFLRFIYTGEIEKIKENAIGLVQMAHKYEVEDLRMTCEDHLVKSVNDDNLIQLYRLADLLKLSTLLKRTSFYFTMNKARLIKDEDDVRNFLQNCPSLILTTFKE